MKNLVAVFAGLMAIHAVAAEYNVRQFGATGTGRTYDTAAIQKALDACKDAGGTVIFPPGIYLSQPLTIYSKTRFQLEAGATLQAGTNQADFLKVPGDWLKAKGKDFVPFIGGENLDEVTFAGGGVIDGGGAAWWDEAEKARQRESGYTLPRPDLIVLHQCRNLRMENITLQNSPRYHLVPVDGAGIVISNVTILAPEHAANTDGIDPSNCKDVLITKCHVDVGDDDVAIKAGRKVEGREFACENIVVTDCTFLHGHGMSIGSETTGGVHQVIVRNCSFENTDYGLRIKSRRGRGGLVEDVVFDHITMKNVRPAITFSPYYFGNAKGDNTPRVTASDAAKAAGKIPTFRNIHVSNLTATCANTAGLIEGLPESPISDVVLENVTITAAKNFFIRNAKNIQLKNVSVVVPGGKPFVLENAQVSGL